jgi:hypothetical protein
VLAVPKFGEAPFPTPNTPEKHAELVYEVGDVALEHFPVDDHALASRGAQGSWTPHWSRPVSYSDYSALLRLTTPCGRTNRT